jgi:hypothetical protein
MNAESADGGRLLDAEAPPVVPLVAFVSLVRTLSCQFDTRNFREDFSPRPPSAQSSQPEAGLAVIRGYAPPVF